jgi:formylglycine-generating enzyme required for sulfatase activity
MFLNKFTIAALLLAIVIAGVAAFEIFFQTEGSERAKGVHLADGNEHFLTPKIGLAGKEIQRHEHVATTNPEPAGKEVQRPPEYFTNSIGMKFAWVSPGTFVMGSPKGELEGESYDNADETQHNVTLTNGFYMGVHLVTQEQWQAVMGGNCAGPNCGRSCSQIRAV